MMTDIDHPHARELESISQILDRNPSIYDLAFRDLNGKVDEKSGAGARGMSAEQVIRAALVQKITGFSYEKLAFHLLDSICYRNFCLIGIADKVKVDLASDHNNDTPSSLFRVSHDKSNSRHKLYIL